MSSSFGGMNLRAFLDDKQKIVKKRFAKMPPTIVFSLERGIYVFAANVAKVNSTIVLAGVGGKFIPIETWFREQINNLALLWNVNVPRAESEINLLPQLFEANRNASRDMVEADLVLLEIGDDCSKDFIARVDFLGNISRSKPGAPSLVVSYKNPEPEAGDGKSDTEDHAGRERELAEHLEKLHKELAAVGIRRPDALDYRERIEETLEGLKSSYPGERGFLNRELLVKKKYSWIYEKL